MVADRVLRVLTGETTFVSDVAVVGTRHVAFVRSPHPHAEIVAVDASAAVAVAGVHAVLTGADLVEHGIRPTSHLMPEPVFRPLSWQALAIGKARYVGDPVALVVADDPYLAADAAELVDVRYRELPWVRDVEEATAPAAPTIFTEWGDNVFVSDSVALGDVDAAFGSAAGVIACRFTHHRQSGLPLEGRGVCASRDGTGRLVVHASTQFPHQFRAVVAAMAGLPLDRVRVVAPDIGGGFGVKQHVTREELAVALAAWLLPYPLKWTQGLQGSLHNGTHARPQQHDIELAYADDGKVLGIRLRILADVGVPMLYFSGAGPALVAAACLPGAYDLGAYACDVAAVVTNTPPVGGFRGFGQPQALLTMERSLDLVAERLGLTPEQVRLTNLIPDSPRPFPAITGAQYDIGSVRAQFRELLRSAPPPLSEPFTGRGYACYVEPTAPTLFASAGRYGAFETATLAVQPDGRVVVTVGTKEIGQGNNAAFARVVAAELGVPADEVTVRDGDTDALPLGLGTMGSRTIVLGGAAVRSAADTVRRKLAAIAAHELAAEPREIDLRDGEWGVGNRRIGLRRLAEIAYCEPFSLPPSCEPGLFAIGVANAAGVDSFPDEDGRMNMATTYASHAASADVRVDPVSGEVHVIDFTVVYDCGTVIDPKGLACQIQGGFAHGLGGVLFEAIEFDDSGVGCASVGEYRVARAVHVPDVTAVSMPTRSAFGIGARGGGQFATILAPAAIANAVAAALRPHKISVTAADLRPATLRRAGLARVLDH